MYINLKCTSFENRCKLLSLYAFCPKTFGGWTFVLRTIETIKFPFGCFILVMSYYLIFVLLVFHNHSSLKYAFIPKHSLLCNDKSGIYNEDDDDDDDNI